MKRGPDVVLDILGHGNIAVTQDFMGRASGCDPPRLSKTTLGVGYSLLTVKRARYFRMILGLSVMQL